MSLACARRFLYRFGTVDGILQQLAAAPSAQWYHGVSLAPSSGNFLSAGPTTLPTVSSTPSPSPNPATATPSSTPVQVSVFQSNSVLLLRAGNGTAFANNFFMPLSWDEVNPTTASVLQTIALPKLTTVVNGVTNYQCSAVAANYVEVIPSQSANGQLVTLPCWDGPAGYAQIGSEGKVIMILRANGSVDTSMRVMDAYNWESGSGCNSNANCNNWRNVYTVRLAAPEII